MTGWLATVYCQIVMPIVSGWPLAPATTAGRCCAWRRRMGRGCWAGLVLVPGDALVDAAVDLGADPLDQAGRYRVVVDAAGVAVRPDRRGGFLVPLPQVHEPKVPARARVFER